MKKILLYTCFGIPVLATAQVETATVKGVLNNVNASTIYYMYRGEESTVNDSAKVIAGKYTFVVKAEMPAIITLLTVNPNGQSRPTKKDFASVFLQSGVNTINSTDSFSNIQVKESKAQAEFVKLNKSIEPFQTQIRELVKPYGELRAKNDTLAMKKIEEDFEALQKKMNEDVYGAYVHNNPSSPIVIYALSQFAGHDMDVAKIEPLFNSLPADAKGSSAGKRFEKKINIAKATAVGSIAPAFAQLDTAGKEVSLSSFKGKYVLIDFWASWCGPCRAENPNVVAAFKKYKDKNFTVLGVSLDDEDGREKWLTAIAKDNLTWTQVSDLKGWENAVAKQYGIQAIPQNFLLDPTGKIVAKNIRGEELHQKLAEIIK